MKGYKGMDSLMRCRDYQYEIGKTYKINGEVSLCKSGFHFCENLDDVFTYYPYNGNNRFFEVYAGGVIEVDYRKCVTSEITILRELNAVEIMRCKYGNGYGNGNGYGYGYGNGDGDGYGYGYGNGNGYGYGNGDGDGYGYGQNIQITIMFK